jgi:hypothetical protein
LEIWIYSEETCMNVTNIPLIYDDRNDYISKLLNNKFNGRSCFGVNDDLINLLNPLEMTSNVEGVYSPKYLYRRMIFETKDLNMSMCNRS